MISRPRRVSSGRQSSAPLRGACGSALRIPAGAVGRVRTVGILGIARVMRGYTPAMGRPRSILRASLATILVTGLSGAGSSFAAGAHPPHDPMLLTRLAAARRVTVQRIVGPPADSCRPDLVIPSDTIACYPASSVRAAPKGQWTSQLLDLSAQWVWKRGRAGLAPRFAPALGVHFGGDSLNADWILSFEPLSAMIRVAGADVASASVPIESHAQLLRLMRDAFPKDALIAGQSDLEEERHSAARHVDRASYGGCDCWAEAVLKSPYKRIASPHDTTGCYAVAPIPVATRSPVYPEFAKEAQIQGTVVLHALIADDGRVTNIRVFRGITGLSDSAVDTVKKWTFKPATKAGQPVCTWIEIPVDFHL